MITKFKFIGVHQKCHVFGLDSLKR